MKKFLAIMIIGLLLINVGPTNISYANHMDINYLDVKVGKSFGSSDYITLFSDNGFYLYDKSDKENEIFQIIDNSIIISSSGRDINILDLGNNLVRTIPGDGSVIIGSGSFRDSIIQVEKNRYRDYISILTNGNQMTVINHIEMDHYLYGVVPREVSPSFPTESLKAQAVAARTFALANINKHNKDGFNLCDTTDCQVYGAMDAENPSTNKAVDSTSNVLVYYKGRLAETIFHSNNGGYIEDSKDVWGGEVAYLTAKEDVFSKNSPFSTWDLRLTAQEVNAKLLSGGINVGELIDMEVLEVSGGNRVLKLKVIGTLKEEIISGAKLRTVLGTTTMKSTWFDIAREGESSNASAYVLSGNGSNPEVLDMNTATIIDGRDNKSTTRGNTTRTAVGNDKSKDLASTYTTATTSFVFKGRGYGHGVGMSQYGAVEMAKQGYGYEDILKHYYTGVDILYNGQ